MKTQLPITALGLALLLLPLVSAPAAPAYVRQELFENVQSFQTGDNVRFLSAGALNGTGPTRLLNNRGEVLYLYGSLPTSQPGLWLPNPNYGLPTGLNDLKAFSSVNRQAEVFNDDGTFFMIVQLPHGLSDPPDKWYHINRGTPAGEAFLANTYSYRPLASRTIPLPLDRRQFLAARGVSTAGLPFGEAQVQWKYAGMPDIDTNWSLSTMPEDNADSGFFLGVPPAALISPVPGAEDMTDCGTPGRGPTRSTFLRVASPNGTVVTVANDSCYNVDTGLAALNVTLAVVGPSGTRTLAVRHSDDARFGVPDVPGAYAVNDAGMVAGADSKGLWLSADAGTFSRSGVTNATSVLIDPAGDIWFARQSNISKWTLSGIYSLALPWAAWGYTGDPLLLSVNNRGQLLVLGSKPDGKSYAVLLSPPLAVSLAVSTNHLSVGDQLIVTATATSLGEAPLTAVSPTGPLLWNGSGAVQLLSGPSPAPPLGLPAGGEIKLQWQCQATTNGHGRFEVGIQALSGTTPLIALPASSESVRIVPNGDLLIKRDVESITNYAGGDIFQTVPNDPQIKTNTVPLNEDSRFQVQIQNKDKLPETFTLVVVPRGGPGWKRTYSLGGQDVTAQLESAGGASLPRLAPGNALTLEVTMRGTNAPPGDIERIDFTLGVANDATLTLDAVEAVTVLTNEIVVNSTGDLPNLPNKDPNGCCCDTGRKLKDGVTPECTLRAAIEFANERPGKDTIKFAIPGDDPGMKGGVPSIQPQTALPDVTDPLIIDGWSQSPASARPPVELSGIDVRPRGVTGELLRFEQAPDPDRLLLPDLASGLHLIAAGCEIRGMVINAFPLCGILVDGPQTQIQGNFLGTDFSGTGSAPSGLLIGRYIAHEHQGAGFAYGGGGAQLCLRSPYNLIGGTDAKARNVISGGPNQIIENGATRIGWVGPPGLVALGTAANGNVIQGNTIGLDESGSHPPIVPPGYTEADVHGTGQYGGVWIHNGSGNQVGGSSPGAGNIIAGNVTGVLVTGESASNNVVAGNQIGWSQNFMGGAANRETGVSLEGSHDNTVGGSDPGAGNTIGSALGIYMGGGRNSVQGNWIGISPDGAVKLGGSMGVLETGSTSQILSNVIANLDDTGLQVQFSDSSRVFGNKIIGCGYDGVRLFGGHGVLISHNSILGNGHSDGMGAGIRVQEATGVTISENSIDGSGDLGISSGPYGAKPTKGSYPALYYRPPPLLSNGQLKIGGEFTGLSGATYLLEFFANEHANPNGYGEGQTFIGSAAVTTSLTGHGVIDVTLPAPHDPGNYVTATATAPDGGTSEFSNAALIEDCAPGTKGVCPGVEQNVPNLSGGPGARALFPASAGPRSALPQATTASGDGNSDGIQDSQQPNVASLPSIAGVWVTLAAPSGTVLENVTPTGPPDFGNVPSGYTFPLGFLSFGITNLPANGVVVVTNFLHLDAAPGFSYAATTFFNYGPTPDNPTPHWYEFNFDGTTGAELFAERIILHFRDGARGDHDLTANGEIVTVGAPAYQIPSGPPLRLLSTTVDWVDTVGSQLDTNGAPVSVTNQTAMANCVLSWPASATNWTLYLKDDLTSSDSIPTNSLVAFLEFFWQPVPELPVVVNGQNVVTNTAISQSRFYRLMPSSWSAGLTTEELAQGTYSWTGTGAWSDPANWSSTALAGGAPLTNGLQIIDVVFPAGASAITSVVDGPYAVRSLSIPAGAPSVDLQSGGARASLTLGAGGLVQQGAGSTTIQPPVILTVDETWLVETGALTVASLNLGSHSLTVTGAGHLVVQDLAGGAASRLAANGPGQVDLGDAVPASSFLGTLAVAGGSVTSSQAMLNFASAVELSGGTLNLPLNAILNSTTAWQVSGGEVVLNGASGNLGPLQLSGAAALGLGSGTGSLTFASATLATTNGQLTVYDWQGAGGVSGTGGKLFVQVAPTAAWLAQVNFVGADFDVGALRLASGEIVPIPKPPSVLPADALAQFQAYGTGLTKTIVAVSGQTFSQAMHIDTTQKPAQAYNSGVVLHTSAAVAANDNLQARFWIRRVAPASGSAQVQFNFELASGTFDKSVQFPITLTDGQWQLKSVKFKSRAAYAAGAAEASFWAGYGVQTVEIGGLEVLNYRGTTPP